MKVTGFSFIRNAVKYDYPIVEAITSILPLCDEFVLAVGQSEDDTLALIEGINSPKIRVVHTVWDDSLRQAGLVLSEETNKAMQAISPDTDWAFYIQGDEVVHEQYLPAIRQAMETYVDVPEVEGLLFKYLHFYGSYSYVGDSYRWYRREIRLLRYPARAKSYLDAQGFRMADGRKLNVKLIDAYIYHYGWVKEPKAMQRKQEDFNKLWHTDEWVAEKVVKADAFDYSGIDALRLFEGTHPRVMTERIARKNWLFDHDPTFNRYSWKDKLKRLGERLTGRRLGEYRNYKII